MADEPIVDAPIRLALRVEGKWWVAYMAATATMERAEEIGRILYTAALEPETKAAFQSAMTLVMTKTLASLGLSVHHVDVRTAPQSERSGSA